MPKPMVDNPGRPGSNLVQLWCSVVSGLHNNGAKLGGPGDQTFQLLLKKSPNYLIFMEKVFLACSVQCSRTGRQT